MRILALLTDAFGGHGGIALYNRDLLSALCCDPRVEEVAAIVRRMPLPVEDWLPAKLVYDTAGVKNWPQYVLRVLVSCVGRKGFDLVVCGHINLIPLAVAAAGILRVPVILEIYGIDAWQPSPRAIANRLLPKVACVIAISEHTRERFLAWSGVLPEKVRLAPNAIHGERYGVGEKSIALVDRYGLTGRTVLLTLGRLVSEQRAKGFDEVLERLPSLSKRLPDIAYVIAGEGEDRPRLERKAAALGVADRVIFTGMVREEEKADLFRLADVYIMPSRGEGFGFVFLEAMACGIPVVASKLDGSREAVRDGELGILVDPGDPAEIEAAVLKSLERPREIPTGLAYFSVERFRQRLGEVLDQLGFS